MPEQNGYVEKYATLFNQISSMLNGRKLVAGVEDAGTLDPEQLAAMPMIAGLARPGFVKDVPRGAVDVVRIARRAPLPGPLVQRIASIQNSRVRPRVLCTVAAAERWGRVRSGRLQVRAKVEA